jgi:hypothetical protein
MSTTLTFGCVTEHINANKIMIPIPPSWDGYERAAFMSSSDVIILNTHLHQHVVVG